MRSWWPSGNRRNFSFHFYPKISIFCVHFSSSHSRSVGNSNDLVSSVIWKVNSTFFHHDWNMSILLKFVIHFYWSDCLSVFYFTFVLLSHHELLTDDCEVKTLLPLLLLYRKVKNGSLAKIESLLLLLYCWCRCDESSTFPSLIHYCKRLLRHVAA